MMKKIKTIIGWMFLMLIPMSLCLGLYLIVSLHATAVGILVLIVGGFVGAFACGMSSGSSKSSQADTLNSIDTSLRDLRFMEQMKQQRNYNNWKK